jgi:cellulose synthase/poly-beta-1,6-N-acetylglucosamine synthase-like glycosyltransferase
MIALPLLLAALCALPAINTFVNAFHLAKPPLPPSRPSVAVLIPARDEAARIEACLDAALASEGVDFEVIVLDDQSTDETAEIVRRRAASDARLRLAAAPPLPPGWKGKPPPDSPRRRGFRWSAACRARSCAA